MLLLQTYRSDVVSQYFVHVKRQLREQKVPAKVAESIGGDQSQKWYRREYTFPWYFRFRGAGRSMTVRGHNERSLLFRYILLVLRTVSEKYVKDHAPDQR